MESIITITYAVKYLLAEGNNIHHELEYEYSEGLTPIIPSIGESFHYEKVDYEIESVNHVLWQSGESSAYRHRVLIIAKWIDKGQKK